MNIDHTSGPVLSFVLRKPYSTTLLHFNILFFPYFSSSRYFAYHSSCTILFILCKLSKKGLRLFEKQLWSCFEKMHLMLLGCLEDRSLFMGHTKRVLSRFSSIITRSWLSQTTFPGLRQFAISVNCFVIRMQMYCLKTVNYGKIGCDW